MKTFKLFVLAILLSLSPCLAQDKAIPSVIVQFQKLYLGQEFKNIYDLYSDGFKQKIPFEASLNLLNASSIGTGNEKKIEVLSITHPKYSLIISGNRSAALVEVTVDSGKISGLIIKPYQVAKKQDVALKAVPTNNQKLSKQDNIVDSLVKDNFKNSVGTAIAVINKGRVTYYGYGETKLGNGAIPLPSDRFEVGSITKTFTAYILANLVSEKKIALDADFRTYLPQIFKTKSKSNPITISQLANHTSGLPSFPKFDNPKIKADEDVFNYFTQSDLENYLRNELKDTAGGSFNYSNLNYAILGYVLETVSGKSYDKLIAQYINRPLRINSTTVFENQPLETLGYKNKVEMPPLALKSMAPAGMIKSTLNDLVIYTKLMMSQAIPAVLAKTITYKDNRREIGLAWISQSLKGKNITFHNGGTTGYRSLIAFNEQNNSAVIILNNSTEDVTALGLNLLTTLED